MEEENIYQKLARATARAIDIELGKVQLADLLDGYTKNKVSQYKIYQVIEDLKGTLKHNGIHKDIRGNEFVYMDVDHIEMLINLLEEVKENG